jgi:hypothetical protein
VVLDVTSKLPVTIFNKLPAKEFFMLNLIAVVLIILWLFGLVTSTSMGGFIHILLVIAVVMILIRLIQGRKIL